jgi:hypothetical protein
MMIAVSEKYALEVGSPTPITSERQHEQYLSVLDKLASKGKPTTEEEKYAEVLMTLSIIPFLMLLRSKSSAR